MTFTLKNTQKRLKRLRRWFKGWVLYLFALLAMALFRTLPRGAALRIAGGLSRLAFHLLPGERLMIRENLRLALGNEMSEDRIEALVPEIFIHQGKNLADFLRGTRINRGNIHRLTTIEGIEHLKQAVEKGRGVITISGHIGNWEILAAWVSLAGFRLSVVGRRLNYPRLNGLLVRTREGWGMEAIDRDRAAKPLLRAIRDNRAIGILIDQDTDLDGIFVPFFGRPTHTPTSPISIAYKTGAAIVPMAIFRLPDDSYRVVIHPEVKFDKEADPKQAVERMTATLSGILEGFIRHDPSQWVWMHRRWRKQPDPAPN